jgi:hypothetical protein
VLTGEGELVFDLILNGEHQATHTVLVSLEEPVPSSVG